MILIVTSKLDSHVEPVARHLDAAGEPWIRLNTEDFATNTEVDISPTSGEGRLYVKDSRREISIERVSAVWYRKPEPVSVRHFDMDQGAREYVEAEFTEVVMGLYSLLKDAVWINNPFSTRIAHRKMLQLKVAANLGLKVPRTVVTNRAETVRAFASSLDGDIAIKSLGAISVMEDRGQSAVQYGIFTRRVTLAELNQFEDKISFMPTLFQEFIEKSSELRITCVRDEAFACRIHTRNSDVTADDYRFDTPNLRHTVVDRPDLIPQLRGYMQAFDLNFGCFDFIETKAGELVFLECNPNGQWYWVEQRTGQPIARAVASALRVKGGGSP